MTVVTTGPGSSEVVASSLAEALAWRSVLPTFSHMPRLDFVPPISASRIVMRGGAIKMQRRGSINVQDQTVGRYAGRAPERRGIWAFPFPYFDDFFANHKWEEVLPKALRGLNDRARAGEEISQESWDARANWIRAHRGLMPIRTFWWEGDVYARFTSAGLVDERGWSLLPSGIYVSAARKVEPGQVYSRDHMEVFLAAGRGKIVSRSD